MDAIGGATHQRESTSLLMKTQKLVNNLPEVSWPVFGSCRKVLKSTSEVVSHLVVLGNGKTRKLPN